MDDETWAEFLDWDEAQMREKESNSLGFRTAVGGLMWVVGGVCPHCFAPVMMLARFLATHRSWHYKQALQIIRYLYINRDVLVIRYTRQEDPTLNNTIFGFVDADWSSGYSRGGYIFMMNGRRFGTIRYRVLKNFRGTDRTYHSKILLLFGF